MNTGNKTRCFQDAIRNLEEKYRDCEDSETLIEGFLRGAAEYYGASRAFVLETDFELGIGQNSFEWCAEGVNSQGARLQFLNMEAFARWKTKLQSNQPVIQNVEEMVDVCEEERCYFQTNNVRSFILTPFSKRISQGFVGIDNPTMFSEDPSFLFLITYAIVVELNEIKLHESLNAARRYCTRKDEDAYVSLFGGMRIIGKTGVISDENIKAEQCYHLLGYLLLNHKRSYSADALAEIIRPDVELDFPYKFVNNAIYRIRRSLSVIGLEKLIVGKNGFFLINPNMKLHTDFERFEEACRRFKHEQDKQQREKLYLGAIELYKGMLLPRIEHELWLMPRAMYYQTQFLQLARNYVSEKLNEKEYLVAMKAATDALNRDPYDSELNMLTIKCLIFHGNVVKAKEYLQNVQEFLLPEHIAEINRCLK